MEIELPDLADIEIEALTLDEVRDLLPAPEADHE